VPSPDTSSTHNNQLNGVSCTSASACTAVGGYTGTSEQTLVEQWDGTTWSIVASPDTSATLSNDLYGVSCTSPSACTAVGEHYTGSYFQTLIEEWNGTTWSIVASPNTSATQGNDLVGVSCTSASACTAIGEYYTGSYYQTLVEQWNGTAWSIVASPNTSATLNNFLYGVSCTSASVCTAVGYASNGSYNQTLVEQWNGTAWSIVASPNTSATQSNDLSGVSCTSASACTAVGGYYGSYAQTLVEQWDGTTWSIVASPNTTTTQDNVLYGVSCTSASACTAAGYYSPPSYVQTLIEEWDGTTWSIVASPNTSATQGNILSGVSCTSASACTAAGDASNGSHDQTLIEMLPGLPVVSSVSPASGPTTGGTTVTISGSNLLGATAVYFGTVASSSFSVTSDTTMSAQAPPEVAGVVDVTVTSPRGTSATSTADQFTYRIPGYDLAGADGGVFVFPVGQSSGFFGSLPGLGVKVNNVVGIVPTNNFTGYNLVGSDGGVFVFPTGQSSGFFGSLPGLGVKVSNVVGIVPTTTSTAMTWWATTAGSSSSPSARPRASSARSRGWASTSLTLSAS
jgi:hypothetical protein